jgi:hypothetical protein
VSRPSIHIVPSGSQFGVRRGGADRTWRWVDAKRDALVAARHLMRNEPRWILYVHDQTGRIYERSEMGS